MRKKFITNLALLLFLNLLVKPFWIFGIDRGVQNAVMATQYGNYFALLQFTFIFNIFLDLGITNYNNRNIAQNSHLLSKHFSNLIVIRIVLAVLYFIISIVGAYFLKWNPKEVKLLLLLLFNQFLLSFILYLRSNLSGLHLFRIDSFMSVLDRLLMIAICSVLLWGNVTTSPFRIEWFVYAQTVSYLITMVVVFLFVVANLEFFKLKFNINFFIVILKQSYPFALLILFMTLYLRINPIMLKHMLPDGDYQSGIYAQSFRVLDAASMFAFLFAGLLLPIFSRMIKKKQQVGQMLELSFLLIIIPALIIATASFFYRNEIIGLLYHEKTELSVETFGILMPAFIFVSSSYIFGTLLTANGSLKALNIMAFSGMVLNIVLNIILIPGFYAKGSAMAALLTQAFTAIAQVIIAFYVFKFNFRKNPFYKLIIFVCLLLLIGYFSTIITNNWLLNISVLVVSGVILSFILKIFSIRNFYEIIKYGDNN